jgi:acyl-CoA thioester hydrolase
MKLPVVNSKVQVRYSDTDAMGHISNESYITYMQVGRLDFYNEITRLTGYDDASVVANINIDFLNECFYGDDIQVVTWCSRVGAKSLTICSEILANGKLVAKGCAVNVGFDKVTRKSAPLPADWQASDYGTAD